jgi:predicted RNase H-like HicB family nuclease
MRNEFTAVIERDGDWYIGYCPEIPGANGQGRTVEECRETLAEAIALILEDRREDGLRGVPPDAIRETVTVGGKQYRNDHTARLGAVEVPGGSTSPGCGGR